MRTGKWPDRSVLGEPVRIEHSDRPEPESEAEKPEEEGGTDPNVVAAFFKTN